MIKTDLDQRLRSLKAELGSSTLVAVSKYSPIEDVLLAYELGQRDFGENRVQDLVEKAQVFKARGLDQVRWHFIGNLQTNKVKELLKVPGLWAIHSVSSQKILEEIMKRSAEYEEQELKLFFQLNTSKEEEKSGFDTLEDLSRAGELLLSKNISKLVFYGLMTMGSIREEDFEDAAKKSFAELVLARETLTKKFNLRGLKLSMGMSQDYKLALSYGADFVRVGSLIFKD